ncbi:MAG: hypothetical protein GXY52_08930 [Chloroflexi bacterium]|nr:hypothetical protein [Chloroflexota bacterium]
MSVFAPPLTHQSERIQRFIRESRVRAEQPPEQLRRRNYAELFLGQYADLSFGERYARSLAGSLLCEPIYLLPDEQLIGMLYQVGPSVPLAPELVEGLAPFDVYKALNGQQAAEIEPYSRPGASFGHVGWRWERLLELGIEGLLCELGEYLTGACDDEARALYQGAIILWQAVLEWNDLHVHALEEAAAAANGAERRRLEYLAEVCRRVPRKPAETFHEALQSFYMQHLAVMFENPYGGNGPGRMDQLLWPYLERDLQAGYITWQGARELIDEVLIRFDERLYRSDGWVEAVTVGGSLADGTTTVNPLSYLIVSAIIELDQTHPSVYVRLSRSSPSDFVNLTTQYLLDGRNRAQVYSDEACLPAIESGGVTPEDAAEFMAGGCMEPSAQGRASDLNFSCTHNVAKTLELVLTGGIDLLTGKQFIQLDKTLTDYPTYEALQAAFAQELTREYALMTRGLDIASEEMARLRPCYLLSSLVDDCLERGREQQAGGARYHDYGFAPLGITSAADALYAIRRAVYEQGTVSAQALLDALYSNYRDQEPLRTLLTRVPNFGEDDAGADECARWVLKTVCDAAAATRTRFYGRLKPMVFNFVWTPGASAALGAAADGSHAGSIIGHGLTPRRLAMGRGVTVAMNSVFKLDCSTLCGVGTTMWDVDERWITPELMRSLMLTFFEGGGMVLQGNTTSVADLQRAAEYPEQYQHLIVRVGGFSARFVGLDKALQQEIIARYRHSG